MKQNTTTEADGEREGRGRAAVSESRVITVSVPLKLTRRGHRKVVIAPDGTRAAPAPQQPVISTLVKALARAHRWKDMLESGAYASVTDLARAENINDSYVCRMLRLTLLAPEIVEAVLGGEGRAMLIDNIPNPIPSPWKEQVRRSVS